MNLKQILIFVVLTIALVVFSYSLLVSLDKSDSALTSVVLGACLIGDILLIIAFFHRFMKSPTHRKQ